MVEKQSISDVIFNIINYFQFLAFTFICVFPFYYLFINTISDNGFGIPDDIKPYVFDRFYTGVIIADGRKSLGLGLALCKSIIKAHNGEILVADNEPNGTKITFTLPIEEVEFHE